MWYYQPPEGLQSTTERELLLFCTTTSTSIAGICCNLSVVWVQILPRLTLHFILSGVRKITRQWIGRTGFGVGRNAIWCLFLLIVFLDLGINPSPDLTPTHGSFKVIRAKITSVFPATNGQRSRKRLWPLLFALSLSGKPKSTATNEVTMYHILFYSKHKTQDFEEGPVD